MALVEVPRESTPLSVEEMSVVFWFGHIDATGAVPGNRPLMYNALGIIGIENGNGRAFNNYNWGNIMAGESWSGEAWPHPSPSPGQPTHFRAYPGHGWGAAAWWSLMYERYRPALERAAADQPRRMVRELYRLGYVVGGDAEGYEIGAARLARDYRAAGLYRARETGLLREDQIGSSACSLGFWSTLIAGVYNHAKRR